MKREYGLDQIEHDPLSVVTVGTFDGVHRGHQAVIRYLQERARRHGAQSVAVTFDPHPREVVHGVPVPLLTTVAERAEVLESLGLDRFIVIPFTKAFSELSAERFVEEVLVDRIGLREVVIGYDHGFGKGRAGDSALLEALGARRGFEVDVIPAQVVDEHVVSSTEVREQLTDHGDVRLAAQLLGRRYHLTGKVVQGDQRGRLLGYPTANLSLDAARKVVPQTGVYAVRVVGQGGGLSKGAVRGGMMNIGVRPTFGESTLRLEVHLFDYEGDLYGDDLRIEFVERVREERRFDGVEALKEQLSQDEERCKALIRGVS